MSRRTPLAALASLAAVVTAGCFYYEEPDDAIALAMRDARAAESGGVHRGRGAPWFLTRIWVRELAADAASVKGPVPGAEARLPSCLPAQRARVRAAGVRVALSLPPEGPHASILLREGETGFAAVARGSRVSEFEDAGATVGGAEVDRGFAVTIVDGKGGLTLLEIAPVFRGPRPGGRETRIARLAIGAALAEGEALVVDAAPGAQDVAVRALFFDEEEGGPVRRFRLYLQVEPFR